MTYWHLLVLAVVCVILALATLVGSDGYDTDSIVIDLCLLFSGIVLGLGALGFGAAFLFGNLDRVACLESGRETGMTVEYELLSGCYVMVDNRLVPYDRWVEVTGVNTP